MRWRAWFAFHHLQSIIFLLRRTQNFHKQQFIVFWPLRYLRAFQTTSYIKSTIFGYFFSGIFVQPISTASMATNDDDFYHHRPLFDTTQLKLYQAILYSMKPESERILLPNQNADNLLQSQYKSHPSNVHYNLLSHHALELDHHNIFISFWGVKVWGWRGWLTPLRLAGLSTSCVNYVSSLLGQWEMCQMGLQDGLGSVKQSKLFWVIDLSGGFPHFFWKIVPDSRLLVGIDFAWCAFNKMSLSLENLRTGGCRRWVVVIVTWLLTWQRSWYLVFVLVEREFISVKMFKWKFSNELQHRIEFIFQLLPF